MARPIAADHEDKRSAILKAAAKLFASHGFDRASMAEIALACGVSKALLYHYYASKDQLLFDIIRAHLDDLVAAIEAVPKTLAPRERLAAMIHALLEEYRHADEEHQIQISDLKRLPPKMKAELVERERVLVRQFSAALAGLEPILAARRELLTPLTMNLFGMMNWKFMWFRENGPVSHAAFAEMVMRSIEAAASTLVADLVPRASLAKR
ncbi:MAG: TetR family transcriptional regulator [Methylobacterium sp.]|uniref:TetR/AcrR family transcriptional regulator n=1 Tax=Rhabdaerophilum sp. TaxID=2717341 RepID=UPI002A22E773|nr:TetR family transcriptional regulator [Methylobacterium sp.]MCA3655487.1 TetR family transcriptional regulator [Methylobacterium sp.]MCA3659359.1 TetR family transcriptional regulator [Methylobacterium sp.]MCA3662528.1 TetR family transcriptional regulator [Methylobacterium sp.]MCA3668174.1 TetR family transcriptional regulator [Methylobacterium sp.]